MATKHTDSTASINHITGKIISHTQFHPEMVQIVFMCVFLCFTPLGSQEKYLNYMKQTDKTDTSKKQAKKQAIHGGSENPDEH